MGGFLAVAGSLMSGLSAYSSGQAQSASYQAQAQAAEMNAQLAQINSEIATSEGKIAQNQAMEDYYKARGRQAAALAQGGILESPTGLLLQEESKSKSDDEQLNIQWKADMNRLNHLIQRGNYNNQAGALRSNAKSSKSGGLLGLAGGLVSGAASGYDYYKDNGSMW